LLEAAIRQLIANEDAVVSKVSEYGTHYAVVGNLIGLNQKMLSVKTIWLDDREINKFRFLTLTPEKRARYED
jgi:hypothetical protein